MSDDEEGSLFGGIDDEVLSKSRTTVIPAIRKNIPVAGVHLNPNLQISPTLAQNLLNSIEEGAYFTSGANQVMLFGRNCIGLDGGHSSGLSPFLDNLVQELSVICRPHLPYRVFSLLFPDPKEMPCTRQVILNRYNPGQGITPHVDLLQRYGDGIIGLSLGSGCVMEFGKVNDDENAEAPRVGVWLEENSIIVLEGEARYKWTHGIHPLHGDVVENESTECTEWIPRRVRTSITLRWLLPGADVVGSLE